MKDVKLSKKLTMAALLLMGMQVALASSIFTGIADGGVKSNKYSLRNLSTLAHRGISIYTIKSGLQFSGSQVFTQNTSNTGLEMNSMISYDRGNTSYVFPYKIKVKVPKFKTPSPSNQ